MGEFLPSFAGWDSYSQVIKIILTSYYCVISLNLCVLRFRQNNAAVASKNETYQLELKPSCGERLQRDGGIWSY